MKADVVTGVVRADNHRLRLLLPAAVGLLLALIMLRGISIGEFHYNVDESQHAATGVFVANLLHDFPSHPVNYTYRYYAQYPALSGVLHWPPFFYLCEGTTFLIFGASVVSARGLIIAFALLGFYLWFRFVRQLQGEWIAALSAVLLATAPALLLFEKSVMLEIPSLALCLGAIYFWWKTLNGERRAIYIFALFASAALLTKQNCVFLLPLCVLTTAALRKWNLLREGATWRALLLVVALVGPFYGIVYWVHWNTIAMDLYAQQVTGFAKYTFFWRVIPSQLGWPLFVLSLAGLVTSVLWAKREVALFMVAWILSCYLTFTLIGWKEARYIIYWLPPFVFFAVGWMSAFRSRWKQLMAVAVALVISGLAVTHGWEYKRPYVRGYQQLADEITNRTDHGIILYDDDLPANFIFFLRQHDPQQRFVVLRKALYTMRIKKEGGGFEIVKDRSGIYELMEKYGIRFVVVGDGSEINYNVQNELRSMLQSDTRFRLVSRIPIKTNDHWWSNRTLLLYEDTRAAKPTARTLSVPMLTLSHDIEIPMSDLGFER